MPGAFEQGGRSAPPALTLSHFKRACASFRSPSHCAMTGCPSLRMLSVSTCIHVEVVCVTPTLRIRLKNLRLHFATSIH